MQEQFFGQVIKKLHWNDVCKAALDEVKDGTFQISPKARECLRVASEELVTEILSAMRAARTMCSSATL